MQKIQRNFIVGDQWLYYKLYTGPKTSELVLANIIKPIVHKLLEIRVIDKWFFIRYTDPDHHIRLRLHIRDYKSLDVVFATFTPHFKKWSTAGLIWKIQMDTYERELERYGSKTIVASESIFQSDSSMVLDFIQLIDGEKGEELRWLLALKCIDIYFDNFKYSSKEKLEFMEDLKHRFGKEFGMSRFLKRQLDIKYRAKRKKIEDFMNMKKNDSVDYQPILKALSKKTKFDQEPLNEILELHGNNELELELDFLVESYIHMFMNRLFKTKNRLHELVCYDFLFRYYKSMVAKNKHSKMDFNS